MNRSIRFLLTAVLAVVMLVGQGFTAFAALGMPCCATPAQQVVHSCCHPVLSGHEKALTLRSNKVQSCQCTLAPNDLKHDKGTVLRDGKVFLIGVNHPNPALSLQVSDSNTPIWLYWHFYPDQSKLYSEKNSWLL